MKRFHIHVAEPTVLKDDYAKWMLDDPRINFAISRGRQPIGVNHLGLQVDSDEELRGMQAQLAAADEVANPKSGCCVPK